LQKRRDPVAIWWRAGGGWLGWLVFERAARQESSEELSQRLAGPLPSLAPLLEHGRRPATDQRLLREAGSVEPPAN